MAILSVGGVEVEVWIECDGRLEEYACKTKGYNQECHIASEAGKVRLST